ncbi:MAG: Uma2 family endonuclease [Chloroflexota bacterium]
MVEVKQLLLPEDIERMIARGELDGDDAFELVDGEIVRLAPVFDPHSATCSFIIAELVPFARRIGGRVLDSSMGFMVGEDLQQLRCPDVSLVCSQRLHILRGTGFARGAPDLAVEVLSQGQHGEAYARPKLGEYFAAGAAVVWFIDMRTRTLREYLAGQREFRLFSGDAAVALDALAPGFSCSVSSFFAG